MKLPATKPLAIGAMTAEELDAELEKGYADMQAGRVLPEKEVFAALRKDNGI